VDDRVDPDAVDPVSADEAGALILFGAQIRDPRLDAEKKAKRQ